MGLPIRKSKSTMNKILYIDSKLVCKAYRKHNPYYMLVRVVEHLNFGKVKVECYWFDIPCPYYPANFLGYDIVEEKDIKELNWHNLLNDIKTAMLSANNDSPIYITVQSVLDGRIIGESVSRYQRQTARAMG